MHFLIKQTLLYILLASASMRKPIDTSRKIKVMSIGVVYTYSATKQLTIIGNELRKRGHEMSFTGPTKLQKLVESRGFEYTSTRVSDPKVVSHLLGYLSPNDYFDDSLQNIYKIASGFSPAIAMTLETLKEPVVKATREVLLKERPDIVIVHQAFGAYLIGLFEELEIPYILHHPFPMAMFGVHDDSYSNPSVNPSDAHFKEDHVNSIVTRAKKFISRAMYDYFVTNPEDYRKHPVLHTFATGVTDLPRYLSPLVCQTGLITQTAIQQYGEDVSKWSAEDQAQVKELNVLQENFKGVILMSMGSLSCADDHVTQLRKWALEFSIENDYALMLVHRDNCGPLPEISADAAQKSTKNHLVVKNWMNQDVILGHEATKVFVTHGGMNSVAESITNQVPMLVIPMFNDQIPNSLRVIENNHGLNLDRRRADKKEFFQKLDDLTTNPKYVESLARAVEENAIGASGASKAADYIEKIAKTGFAHLIPSEDTTPWYISTGFDVVCLVVVIPSIVLAYLISALVAILVANSKISRPKSSVVSSLREGSDSLDHGLKTVIQKALSRTKLNIDAHED
mmetsp:Transcript_15272/g.23125  ORF Transcript_15272/g.23125 Transcript_15272/m.23125 type:complete len:568 (-) Transcript_15272:152-1855(-)